MANQDADIVWDDPDIQWEDAAPKAKAPEPPSKADQEYRARQWASWEPELDAKGNPKNPLMRATKWLGEGAADFVNGAGDLFGLLDTPIAAGATGLSYVVPTPAHAGRSPGERFRAELADLRARHEIGQQRSPWLHAAGQVAPALMGVPIPAPASAAAAGATGAGAFGTQALAGVTDAALINGASAASSNLGEDSAPQRVYDAMTSAWNLVGGVPAAISRIPRVPQQAGEAWGRFVRKITGVKETDAAKALANAGVNNLTSGQRADPESFVSRVEELTERNPIGMGKERREARERWMDVGQEKGLPPGMQSPEIPPGLSHEEAMQARNRAIEAGFKTAYAPFKKVAVRGSVIDGLPERALTMQTPDDFAITDSEKAEAARKIKDALSVVPHETPAPEPTPADGPSSENVLRPKPPPTPPEDTNVGRLQRAREVIRERKAEARRKDDSALYRQYAWAEHVVTDAMDASLAPEQRQAFRDVDRAYARWMVSMNAGRAGKTEFSPSEWNTREGNVLGKRRFRLGLGGDMQDFGEQGQRAFDNRLEHTGFSNWVLNFPLVRPMADQLSAPFARSFNQPSVRAGLWGDPYTPNPTPYSPADVTPAQVFAQILRSNRERARGPERK